jgi:hypothetical protein
LGIGSYRDPNQHNGDGGRQQLKQTHHLLASLMRQPKG